MATTPDSLLNSVTTPEVNNPDIEINIAGTTHKLKANEVEGFVNSIANTAADEIKRRQQLIEQMQQQAVAPVNNQSQPVEEQFSTEKMAKLLNDDPKEAWNYGFKFSDEKKRLEQEAQLGRVAYMQFQEATFLAKNPDFTPQAAPIVKQIMQTMNLPANATGYDVAWTYAKKFMPQTPAASAPQEQNQFSPQQQQSNPNQTGYFPPGWNGNSAPPPSAPRQSSVGIGGITPQFIKQAENLTTAQLGELINKLQNSGYRP